MVDTVNTIKFSQFVNAGDLANGETTVGLAAGTNAYFNNPWTFLASGTTGDRPVPSAAIYYRLRFNTSLQEYEYYDPISSTWTEFGSGSGNINPGVTNDLAFYAASGTDISPISAAANSVLVTNGSSVPSLSTTLPSGLTIPGATITGSTAALTAGSVTAAPVAGNDITNKTYVDGLFASGVESITGTTNQVIASSPTGNVTLSLPQNIATGSTPTFAGMTLTNIPLNLASGGTDNQLTASLGGVVYSDATKLQILAGTATAELPLLSGSSAAPTWGAYALNLGGALTTAGALTTSGAYGVTFTFTGITGVTFPTSGTLATTATSGVTSVSGTALQIDVSPTTGATVVSIDPGYVGQTSITTLGTIGTGFWAGTNVALNHGGTNAALTASNGGVVYSTASALAILAGTATANLPLLSGSSAAPAWGSYALSLGGALTTAGALTTTGAFSTTFNFTASTNVTFPTSGTLATTASANVISVSGTSGQIVSSPTTGNVVVSIDPTYVGQTSITTLGTISTGTWAGTNVALNHGGSNAALTASNGGIVYSTASAMAILAGTATAGQLLTSGASTTPAWTTTTYPSTNAINTLLYASSANVMSALATANDGVLITSNTGVPSWLANSGTPGYVLTANAGAPPSWQNISADGAISQVNTDSGNITPSSGIITISGSSTGLTTTGSGSTVGLTGNLALSHGGLNANLTASNGGIFYSTASAGAILAGTATANQLLLSGASTTPAWSTSTYPTTNAANTLLYASSANTMAALATADSGVLVTSSGGVPSISTALPSGLTNYGALRSFQTFTSGSAATYTLPAGIKSILVEVIGGGGGGGGTAGGTGTIAVGAGGGGGGYAALFIASPSSTYTYTVGTGGSAGASGGGVGGTGNTTTFSASSLQATGGTGGSFTSAIGTSTAAGVNGGLGGIGSNGDINVRGGTGEGCFTALGSAAGGALSGSGGNTHYGGGAITTGIGAGNTGGPYGGGGSGAFSTSSNAAGGAGAAGLIRVWEFG